MRRDPRGNGGAPTRFAAVRRFGYTLIEIMGAVLIMTIILTLVTSIFVENGRQRAAALGMMQESLTATAALDQMAQDLEGAVYLVDTSGRRPDEYPWRFTSEGANDLGAASVRFVTQNAPASNRARHASRWVEVVYFLEEDDDDVKTLWRWMSPRPPSDANPRFPDPDDEGAMRVAVDVSGFGMRFRGPQGEWLDEWDSGYQPPANPIPGAAEINLAVMRDARVGEAEDDALRVPGPLHTRRVPIRMQPIDVNALLELAAEDEGEDDGDQCFTVADCVGEGQADWYYDELDSNCGGNDELCDLLSASDGTCWSTLVREYSEVAAGAPASCTE